MAKPRLELQSDFKQIMGDHNVYFNPPDGMILTYPCIVYNISGDQTVFAGNKLYTRYFRYEVTLMDTNVDTIYDKKIIQLGYCKFQRTFTQDNIHHWVYEIFN